MKCSQCDFDNKPNKKFCIKCGSKLILKCPQCALEIEVGDDFCGECGHDLREAKPAAPIDYSEPQSYTPKFLAEKILTTRSSIEGERKLVTVLFADVASYTALADKLDPEEVHQIMDGAFKILMDEIHRFEGTINQFTGDGVMALFGAPMAHEDHAQRACHAALSIQKAIVEYGTKVEKESGVEFKMRIGLNSGPVIVGSIGDDLRMDYTAVGDTTNLASRIENMARPGTSLISGHTHKLARAFFEFKSLEKVEVKGKAELQEVYEIIKASEVETRIAASVAKGLTRFIGRKKELEALEEAFKKAESGSGQVMGIVGEAGVGKSRLLLELRNMLPDDEYTYLEGQCLHFGGSMVYLPVLDILRSYFEIKEGDRAFLIKQKLEDKILQLDEKLQDILPPFHELLSLEVEDKAYQKLEPMQKREKTFEAIRNLLVRESQNKPIVLVVEDLHWIDKTSEEFLSYLIEWLANTRILLILIYRPEYTHTWGSKSYYTQIGLDQLSTKTSAELVQTILEGGEVAPELRKLILNRAAGNPLFMEEFAHTLLENGSIQQKDNQYVLDRKASDIQVPDTIQGIIAARMDRLEENLKRTMQVASVIGKDFAFRILETIMGMKEELKSHLLNLQGLEFIYETSLFPELEYVFKHALTQEVAYNSLLLKKRTEIHEKIGQAIEEIYPERLEEFYEMLAYNYSKGENLEKAYRYFKLSGNKAAKNYSNSEALHFYKEAFELLGKMPESEEDKRKQIEVHLLMALSMFSLGFPENSLGILQKGERLSKELGDEKSHANFLSLIGQYYAWQKGNLPLGIKYSEDSFKAAEKINDIGLLASTGGYLCLLYWWSGKCSSVIDLAPKIIALIEKTERQSESFENPYNLYSVIHAWYANCSAMLGNFEEAISLIEKGFNFALEIKNLGALAVLELQYGWLLNFRGDGKNAIAHLQNLIGYCEEGQFFLLPPALLNLGWSHFLLGNLKTARESIEKGLKNYKEAGVQIDLGLFYWLLGMIHFESDDIENAQGHAEKALKLSQKMHQKGTEGFAWILLGRIFGKAEKPEEKKAEDSLLQGIKILEELKLKTLYATGYHFLGAFYVDSGQKDKALKILKKAETMFKEMGMDYWLAKTKEVLKRL
ncbi:MAG TPA: guanylate cyclase [Desulfobacterales bacterium]|nr:guanylate cyclase [Desulfobacterales bacterium]